MSKNIRTLVKGSLEGSGGRLMLGDSTSYNFIDDPARLLFSLSRYKFVAKMFAGFERVLEVGCADGVGGFLVSKSVRDLVCVDIDADLVNSASECWAGRSKNMRFECGDVTDDRFLAGELFDGIFLLDVLEHISRDEEDFFLRGMSRRLTTFGSMIIGMPSIESQVYASTLSKIGHVNCKSQNDLRALCAKYFNAVYIFGANDEIVHTGYSAMQHYRLALCVAPRVAS